MADVKTAAQKGKIAVDVRTTLIPKVKVATIWRSAGDTDVSVRALRVGEFVDYYKTDEPTAPPEGYVRIFVDKTTTRVRMKLSNGEIIDFGAVPHNLLSAYHPDVQSTTVARGMLIVGRNIGGVTKWAGLPLGSAGSVLKSSGQDAVWDRVTWDEILNKPQTFPPSAHTHPLSELTQSGAQANQVPKWSGSAWVAGFIDWAEVANKPSQFPPSAHTHSLADLTQSGAQTNQIPKWSGTQWVAGYVLWDEVANKPTTYPPASHTHPLSDLTQSGAQVNQVPKWSGNNWIAGFIDWSEITGKPTQFPPTAHTHDAGDIASGRLSFARLPTSDTANRFLVVRAANSNPVYDTIQASDLPAHTHSLSQLTQSGAQTNQVPKWSGSAWTAGFVDWNEITNKPSIYPPASHTHSLSDLTQSGAQVNQVPKWSGTSWVAGNISWGEVTNKPSTFPPEVHTHAASDITSGRLALSRLPTSTVANRFLVVRTANEDPTYDTLRASDLPTHTHSLSDLTQSGAQTNQVPKWSGSAWAAGFVDWNEITNKPATYPPTTHTHDAGDITSGRLSLARLPTSENANRFLVVRSANSNPVYDTIQATDLPTHTHTLSQLTQSGAQTNQVPKWSGTQWAAGFVDWNEITNKPSAYPPTSHTHDAGDITSGRLSLARLPTTDTANRFLVVRTANGNPVYDTIQASDLPAHTHSLSQLTQSGAQTNQVPKWSGSAWVAGFVDWNEVSNKPTQFPPSAHTHAPSDISPQGHNSGLNADMLDGAHASAFVPTTRRVNAGLGLTGGGTLANDITLSVAEDSTIQKVEVAKQATLIGARKQLNFIPGSNVILDIQDNSAQNRIDITISAVGGGGSSQHNLLDGLIHPDTESTQVARGMLIVGKQSDSVVKWGGLPLGASGTVLKSNGSDAVWDSVNWDEIQNKPSTFPPTTHSHPLSQIQQSGATAGDVPKWSGSAWQPGKIAWDEVQNKPTQYPPTAHSHAPSDITPQGHNSGLNADTVDGYHASSFSLVGHTHPLTQLQQSGATLNDVVKWDGEKWAPGKVQWNEVQNKPSVFPPETHTHPLSQLQQSNATVGDVVKWSGSQWQPAKVLWDEIQNKPTQYPPTSHNHAPSDITPQGHNSTLNADLLDGYHAADFAPVTHTHTLTQITQSGATVGDVPKWSGSQWQPGKIDWSEILNKPAQFPPTSHTHAPSDITPQGHNSGLNADALDGYHASDFALASHTHSLAQLTQSGATANDVVKWDGEKWAPGKVAWNEVQNKPSTFPPEAHTHALTDLLRSGAEVNDVVKWDGEKWAPGRVQWAEVQNKPSAFPPEAHTHSLSQLTQSGAQVNQVPKWSGSAWVAGFVDWNEITNKPSAYPPESHTHDASQITSGRLSAARLPTSSTANRFLVVRTANGDPTYDTIKATDLPTHTHSLSDLTQSGAQTNQVPKWSGSAWVAGFVDWGEITNKPATYPPSAHTHAPSDITPQGHNSTLNADLLDGYHASDFAPATHTHTLAQITQSGATTGDVPKWSGSAWQPGKITWAEVQNKPSTFPPEAHNHAPSDISPQGHNSGLDADKLDGYHAADFALATHTHPLSQLQQSGATTGDVPKWTGTQWAPSKVDWTEVQNKPSTFPPASHTHAPSDITPQGHNSGLNADMLDGVHASALVPTSRRVNAGTGLTGGGTLESDITLSVVADSTVQRVEVARQGTLVGTRKRINFIPGSYITIDVQDDATNNKVDVTISAVGGGGGGAHNLLDGSVHPDTEQTTVARGMLIVGKQSGATVKWGGLPLGSSGQFLRSNGTDAVWSAVTWNDVQNKPSTFPPEAHTHPLSQITQSGATTGDVPKWSGTQWQPGKVTWDEVQNKPSTYPPSAHTHPKEDLTDATQTPTPYKIPIANSTGKLDLGWIPSGVDAGKLQGRNVATTAPTDGQVLAWSAANNQWQPTTIAGGGVNFEAWFVLNPINTNTWYIPYATNCTALTTLALTASRIYYIPFIPPRRIRVTALAVEVTTASAGTGQIGIYDTDTTTWRPRNLIVVPVGIDTGSTGVKSGSVNVILEAGKMYWLALINSSAATLRALAVGGMSTILGIATGGTAWNTHYFQAGTGGTLPSTAGANSNGTGNVPVIYIRYEHA